MSGTRIVTDRNALRWPRSTPVDDYSRLHPNEDELTFRVLELAPLSEGQPLKGKLITHVRPMEQSPGTLEPNYEALSYCWGTETTERFIELDGKQSQITPNLYDALQHLRFERLPRTLWIDQICINQRDVRDRNRQVQQMHSIYAGATSVTAWLGNATAASETLLGALSHVDDRVAEFEVFERQKELQEGHPTYESMRFHLRAAVQAQHRGSYQQDTLWRIVFAFLETLMANPWFQRIWIVQEAALATSLFFQAGDKRASWKLLIRLIDLLEVRSLSLDYSSIMHKQLLSVRYKLSRETEPASLSELVSSFRTQKATDPRDKVYALLGLAKESILRSNQSLHMLQADYSKETQQIFADLTVWHISSYRDLDALASCCAGGSGNLEGLPSWARDWSQEKDKCHPLIEPDDPYPRLYQACGTHWALAEDMPVESGLTVTGVLLDVVEEVADKDLNVGSHEFWLGWRDLALKPVSQDPYGGAAGRLDAFWRTLIADMADYGARAPVEVGEDLRMFTDFMTFQDQSSKSNEETVQHQCDRFAGWWAGHNMFHTFGHLFRGRRGYLGLSCQHVEVGDKISILWGGRLPFLLREARTVELPSNSRPGSNTETTQTAGHQLIGGYCYIHGLADGQGLEIAEKEGIMPEKICLVWETSSWMVLLWKPARLTPRSRRYLI